MPSRYWRSTVAIHCNGFYSPEQEATILGELAELRDVFPSWVREVWVSLRSLDNGDILICDTNVPYRSYNISVSPDYFSYSTDQRKSHLTHEVVHAILGPIVEWVSDRFIEPMKESDERLYAVIEQEWRDRFEGVTQEWTYILERMMAKGEGE